MSEALTFQLVKNKILNIEAYEIWAYSIEIILLNGSIIRMLINKFYVGRNDAHVIICFIFYTIENVSGRISL